jgi:hypothetical protein
MFPMAAFKAVYKAKWMAALRKLIKQGKIAGQPQGLLEALYQKDWVIYAKKPFGGAQQVINYIGRYSHKVAITNQRLLGIDAQNVQFTYKDYAQKGQTKVMELSAVEFLRRFCQHILPSGFTKIRHYGLHAGACEKIMDLLYLELCHGPRKKAVQEKHTIQSEAKTVSGNIIYQKCPNCQQKTLAIIAQWLKNKPPPAKYKHLLYSTL